MASSSCCPVATFLLLDASKVSTWSKISAEDKVVEECTLSIPALRASDRSRNGRRLNYCEVLLDRSPTQKDLKVLRECHNRAHQDNGNRGERFLHWVPYLQVH